MKDLFLKLVQISSPSSHEEAMRIFLMDYFSTMKLEVIETKKNVVVNIPGKGKPVMLVAHIDTVQQMGENVKPILKNGVIRSDGTTILGADNKAGVCILMKMAEELLIMRDRPSVILAFTSNEEAGRMTAWELPIKKLLPQLVLNVDGGKAPGVVDVAALGQMVFEIEFIGKAAHAATNPEKGENALVAAVKFLGKLNIGKYKNGDTLNIGKFECDSKTNIVPNKVNIKGEIRSFSQARLALRIKYLKKLAKSVDVKIKFHILPSEGMPVWEEIKNKKWSKLLFKAALRSGLIYKEEKMFASSDANVLARFGIPTYSINRGGENPHSNQESITISEMESTKQFIMEIINQYGNIAD